jgi:hypothetical protein
MDLDLDPDLDSIVGEAITLAPADAFGLFIDTAALHRDAAIDKGFTPEAAEQMAVALHSGMVALYCTSAGQ